MGLRALAGTLCLDALLLFKLIQFDYHVLSSNYFSDNQGIVKSLLFGMSKSQKGNFLGFQLCTTNECKRKYNFFYSCQDTPPVTY